MHALCAALPGPPLNRGALWDRSAKDTHTIDLLVSGLVYESGSAWVEVSVFHPVERSCIDGD